MDENELMNTPICTQLKIDDNDIILTELVLDHLIASPKNYDYMKSGKGGDDKFSKEEFIKIVEKTKAESNEKSVL